MRGATVKPGRRCHVPGGTQANRSGFSLMSAGKSVGNALAKPAETVADDDHTRIDTVPLSAQRTVTVNENGSSLMERMSWPTSIR